MSNRPSMSEIGGTEEFGFGEDRGPSVSAPDEVPGVRRYWGKYRGVVVQPVDPEMRCRINVKVEDVWGPNVSSWALPCLPYGGLTLGMYVVPMVGANVWVEFLHGHPDHPIWTGFWYGSTAHTPKSSLAAPPGAPHVLFESLAKHAVLISDAPVMPWLPMGGILLKSGLTTFIAIEPTGIRMFGMPAGVSMNSLDGTPATAGLHVT